MRQDPFSSEAGGVPAPRRARPARSAWHAARRDDNIGGASRVPAAMDDLDGLFGRLGRMTAGRAARGPHEPRRRAYERSERTPEPVVFDTPAVIFGLQH